MNPILAHEITIAPNSYVKKSEGEKRLLHKSVGWTFDAIRDGLWKDGVIAIRKAGEAGDAVEYKRLKETGPAIMFCGRFRSTSNDGLVSHSQLIPIDYEDISEKRRQPEGPTAERRA